MAREPKTPCPVCALLDSRDLPTGSPYCNDPGSDACVRRGYIRVCDLVIAKDVELAEKNARLLKLEGRINTPHADDWFSAVRLEAAHQQERWCAEHDAGKEPADWFWLLGYLGGKAVASAIKGDVEKAKHHTISSAAVMLNWFRHMVGEAPQPSMRPGIEEPRG